MSFSGRQPASRLRAFFILFFMEHKHENPSYYAVLTSDVRYDQNICNSSKLLYAEITALTNKHGYCFASNTYFATLYNVSTVTISRWIKSLIENGHLRSEIDKKSGNKRRLYLLTKMLTPINKNVKTPINKNVKYNTINNNTIIEEEKEENSTTTEKTLMSKNKQGVILSEVINTTLGQEYLEKIISGQKTISDFEKIVKVRQLKSFVDWTNEVGTSELEIEKLQQFIKVKSEKIKELLKEFYNYHRENPKMYTKKDFVNHFVNWNSKRK